MNEEQHYTRQLKIFREAETLTEITLTLTSVREHTTVLDEILRQAHRLVPYQAASIVLLEEDTLHVVHSRGYDQFGSQEFITNLRQKLADLPIEQKVIDSGQAYIVNDAQQLDGQWVVYDETTWIRSHLTIPIRLHQRTLGLLRIDDPRPDQFTARDITRLQPIIHAAAIALENARLLAAANKRVALLEAVRQAGLSVTSRLELSAVLKTILQSVSALLEKVTNNHVFLYDGQTLTFGAAFWAGDYHQEPIASPRPHGLTYTTARSGQPVIVPDIQSHPLFEDAPPEWYGSIISLPLQIEERVVGVMNVAFARPHTRLEFELFVLMLMADQAAIAIENAHLYEQTQREIAERKRAESALRQSEARYRQISELTSDFAYALKIQADQSITLEWVTDAFTRITGYEPEAWQHDNWSDFIHPDDEPIVQQRRKAILAGQPYNCQFRILTQVGETRWVRDYTRPVWDEKKTRTTYVYGATQDITEYKQMSAALQRTQKLESMGIVASGIAHDFNNVLTAVMAQSSAALMKLPESHAARESIENIIHIAERASELTRQLLTFAGEGHYQLQSLDLGQVVEHSLSLIAGAIPKTISLQTDLPPGLPSVLADQGQIQQVLMNLVINAAEAYENRPGLVKIRVEAKTMAAADWDKLDPLMVPGDYVCLEVIDWGKGMDKETAVRVFDPFFTTKRAGRGLGMAAVQGIVHAHHGHVSFNTAIDQGTTFQLFLPVATSDQTETVSEKTMQPTTQSQIGNILLIDDEAVIRTAVSEYLQLTGFSVLTAEDGQTGLEIFRQQQEQIGLVLLDVTMPVMTGMEALAHIRQLSADVPIIMLSGLDEPDTLGTIAKSQPTTFLKKPFRLNRLVEKINMMFGQ